MIDSLRDRLAYACKDVCVLALSEDEDPNYPYAVYDMTSTPMQDKDGVYGYSGETRIRVVSNDPDEADILAGSIQEAISTGMYDEDFFSHQDNYTKECTGGIWTIEMNYTLKQYADWSEPVESVTNTE